MRLVATYDMIYGHKGRHDAEPPLVRRGDEFDSQPTVQASAEEVGRILIRNGVAMTPDAWSKRKKVSDFNARWAADETAKARAAYLGRRSGRGA